MCSQGAEVACVLAAYAWCESCALFALRAVDPCAPLGVLECARWALSERARDGLCVVLVASYGAYCAACVLGAVLRAPQTGHGAASPEQFWPGRVDPRTFYVWRRPARQKTPR